MRTTDLGYADLIANLCNENPGSSHLLVPLLYNDH